MRMSPGRLAPVLAGSELGTNLPTYREKRDTLEMNPCHKHSEEALTRNVSRCLPTIKYQSPLLEEVATFFYI